jgi:hydrogenase expression/formation protein HypC
MCLAIPGLIIRKEADEGVFKIGLVDFDGIRKKVVLNYVPEAEAGDYVIVHVGFAITRIRAAEAQTTFAYLGKILDDEIPS